MLKRLWPLLCYWAVLQALMLFTRTLNLMRHTLSFKTLRIWLMYLLRLRLLMILHRMRTKLKKCVLFSQEDQTAGILSCSIQRESTNARKIMSVKERELAAIGVIAKEPVVARLIFKRNWKFSQNITGISLLTRIIKSIGMMERA